MKICVVGAGIIGVTTAYALAQRGHEVTVVDALSSAGRGASHANGAQLSYSYVAPLADPSVWKSLPGYLFQRRSPLTFRPKFDPAQWRWIARFLMACNTRASAHATAELVRLAFFSRDCLASLQAELVLDFDFREAGKLVMFSSDAAIAAARRQVRFQEPFGCEQKVLSTAACIEVEPALAASAERWAGGVHTASEQVGDCARFCEQLIAALAHRGSGVRFAFDTTITGAVKSQGRLAALQSSGGDITADAFVLANGVGSARIASTIGLALPIYPLKGYSVTFDAADIGGMPEVSITDFPNKIVYARIGNRLRVAGRIEIVGSDTSVDAGACRLLADEARRLFPQLRGDGAQLSPWAGQRPATPTGMPIIGRTPMPNVFLNTGHGALGWTLACGSAELLASRIEGQQCAIGGDAFSYIN